MKIVINKCYGGFGLSEQAHSFIAKRKGWQHACDDYDNDYWYCQSGNAVYSDQLKRDDPDLVAAVEQLGKDVDGSYSLLKVVEIPDGVDWYIHEYDGLESVYEKHRSWE